jgi:hypothetical protein
VSLVCSYRVCIGISRENDIAEKIAEEGGFSSVSELIEFLIEPSATACGFSGLSSENEKMVARRLRKPGYF